MHLASNVPKVAIRNNGNKFFFIFKKRCKGFTIVLRKSRKKITQEFISGLMALEELENKNFEKEMLLLLADPNF